jgi:antitoxin component YwqK of YwqJK toxin-antitoxin module
MNKQKTEVTLIERNGRTFSQRTEFFENGQISKVGVYTNGLNSWSWNIPTGIVKSFWENGQLKSEITYNDFGSLDGESKYYDAKGAMTKKSVFSNDVLIEEQSFVSDKEK